VTLLATLDMLGCRVCPRRSERDADSEFIGFLESLALNYPRQELHMICDGCKGRRGLELSRWLAGHSGFYLRLTSTRASWLGLIERWFSLIVGQSGRHQKITRLECEVMRWLSLDNVKPFRWTATPLA